jgi:HTH-type transcriptional regulator / antitoxin HipB
MSLTDNLSQLLLRTRQEQGLSREELASLAQVSTSFIRDAESDAERCSFGKLQQLCTALGLRWTLNTHQTAIWPAPKTYGMKAMEQAVGSPATQAKDPA